jgi:(2Fe-2S) ferredoxin
VGRSYRVVICRGPECGDRRGSEKLRGVFEREIATRSLGAQCELAWQSCFGRCRQGPNVLVRLAPPPEARRTLLAAPVPAAGQHAALYNGVLPEDVGRIIDTHIVGGSVLRELVLRPEAPPRFPEDVPWPGDRGER